MPFIPLADLGCSCDRQRTAIMWRGAIVQFTLGKTEPSRFPQWSIAKPIAPNTNALSLIISKEASTSGERIGTLFFIALLIDRSYRHCFDALLRRTCARPGIMLRRTNGRLKCKELAAWQGSCNRAHL
jgi:hypothetical protein